MSKPVPVGTFVRRVKRENWRIGHITGHVTYPGPIQYFVQFAPSEPSVLLDRSDFRVVRDQAAWKQRWGWYANSKKSNRP